MGLNNCVSFTLVLLVIALFTPYVSHAQTGSIIGEVRDAETGEGIVASMVTLEGIGHKTVTDIDGRFNLSRIPVGDYRLLVDRTGYVTHDVNVSVNSGERRVEHIELTREHQENSGGVFIQSFNHSSARALGTRRTSTNFGSVITSEQMDHFGDYTIEDALVRVSGVQADRRGTINLRGVGPGRYYVTLDGQRLGTTGTGERSYDLGSISSDLVREVEVNKVLTPDMDADALAGSINLKTRLEPGGARRLGVRIGGGGDTRYFPFTGLNSRGSVSYSEALREDLTLAVNVSHMSDHRGRESLDIEYDVADFGQGPVDVIERISPGLYTDASNRTGGVMQLTFHPTEQASYYIRGMINDNTRERTSHVESSSVNGDWLRADTTGATGGQGTHAYNMGMMESDIRQYAFNAGGRHLFEGLNLEYRVGWAQSRFTQEEYQIPFMETGLDFSIDMGDRTRPILRPTNTRILDDGTIDRVELSLQDFNRMYDEHIDNTLSTRLDAEIPLGPVMFKGGSRALWILKNADISHEKYSYQRPLNAFRFGPMRSRTKHIRVFNKDEYLNPWLLDSQNAVAFFNNNPERVNLDEAFTAQHSHIRDYASSEKRYAGYGMATVDLWMFTIMGGARVEYDDVKYEGNIIRINEDGTYRFLPPVTESRNQTHFFPHAQIRFSPMNATFVKLAYSKSMERPVFHHLAPFERINFQDSTIFRGNPNIEPVLSNNLDIMVEQYLRHTGIFSLGFFYKQLENLVFERHRTISGGDLDGFQETTFDNSGETVTLYGMEISWKQRLEFLPGFLGNFSTWLNYTWSQSIFDTEFRDDEVTFPGQSPHVINTALDYSQNRLSAQLAWHWTAEALLDLQRSPYLAPSIDPVNPVYRDRYQDGWTSMSASFKFRLSNNFRFWADANNLLGGVERLQYAYNRSDYPVGIDLRQGISFNFGIQYSL